MQINDYTISMAVLRVFRDHQIFRAGGSLFLSTLNLAWEATGLRQRDLRRGIEILRQSHCVQVSPYCSGADLLITLQAEGAQRLTRFPQRLAQWVAEIRGALALRQANRRHAHGEFLRRVRCSLYGFHPTF